MISKRATFKFRLYVAADSPNSKHAVLNLQALCRQHLHERHEIEIIDILREPKRALAEGILLTPVLVKLSPAPTCEILGNLSHTASVIQALGLTG
jgi:circadian clock protein KaiB